MRSAYFWRMRSASALRLPKGCSSLNLDRMMAVYKLGDCRAGVQCKLRGRVADGLSAE
jgi:hypothetical protein